VTGEGVAVSSLDSSKSLFQVPYRAAVLSAAFADSLLGAAGCFSFAGFAAGGAVVSVAAAGVADVLALFFFFFDLVEEVVVVVGGVETSCSTGGSTAVVIGEDAAGEVATIVEDGGTAVVLGAAAVAGTFAFSPQIPGKRGGEAAMLDAETISGVGEAECNDVKIPLPDEDNAPLPVLALLLTLAALEAQEALEGRPEEEEDR
jgi:hypothetical protein